MVPIAIAEGLTGGRSENFTTGQRMTEFYLKLVQEARGMVQGLNERSVDILLASIA